jgi:hypothetical protein
METVESLMDKYPGLRIIHIIRDPRSVVLSRVQEDWAISGSTNGYMIRSKYVKENNVNVNRTDSNDYSNGDTHVLDMIQNGTEITHFPNDLIKEAYLYCNLVMEDIKVRKRIENNHPGSTYQVIYEHVMASPEAEVIKMYDFIDEIVPKEVISFLNLTNTEVYIKQISKWKNGIAAETAKDVYKYCLHMFKEIDFIHKE